MKDMEHTEAVIALRLREIADEIENGCIEGSYTEEHETETIYGKYSAEGFVELGVIETIEVATESGKEVSVEIIDYT